MPMRPAPGEEHVVVTLPRTDHLEGEGRDEGEIERPAPGCVDRSVGGGAAWRVWPKWTVTSPGSVVERHHGSLSVSCRDPEGARSPGASLRSCGADPPLRSPRSSWMPMLSIGHFTGCPPIPQSRCQGRSARPVVCTRDLDHHAVAVEAVGRIA